MLDKPFENDASFVLEICGTVDELIKGSEDKALTGDFPMEDPVDLSLPALALSLRERVSLESLLPNVFRK